MPLPSCWCKPRRVILKHFDMELSYSELNEIYLVAQVNEAESDYKKALNNSGTKLVYRTQQMAIQTSQLLNKHKNEPGYKWVACKAHVYTESKLQLDNAQLI